MLFRSAPRAAPVTATAPFVRYVDPLLGTGGAGFNVGNTYPGPQAPFGLARPGPDTSSETGAAPFAHCAGGCSVSQLTNVLAARVYVLARSNEATPGYTDTKTYTLGTQTLGPFNDGFKRHVFSTTVRFVNITSRRETP